MRACWGLFLLGLVPCAGQSQNPFAGDAQAAEAGRGIFRIYCSPCHGIHGKGGRGPDLTRGVYEAGERDEDLHRVIHNGAAGTEMPAYSVSLGRENIWRIVTYIRSIARPDAEQLRGDTGRGEKLFWGKGGCGQCHRAGQRGGRMGPDLSRAGRTRSLAYLRESVVAPNADLTPGYNTVTVVTRDGKRITGVQKGYDNFSAQLMDAGEAYHSFFRDEVRSIQREFRSLMPDTYGKMFSGAEVDDLVAYMSSLKGEEASR